MILALLLHTAAIGEPLLLAAPPAVDVETTVTVQDAAGTPSPGATVRVTYRPGLDGEREVAVGITDGLGRVRWTPDQGGVAELRAGPNRRRVEIERGGAPASSLTLVLLLLLASLGALAYGVLPRRRWRPNVEPKVGP